MPATPARILIVDDEPDLRTLYELTLLREGHKVEAAGTVSEAMSLLKGHGFDLIITDMRLPDGLGLDILQHVTQTQRREKAVVITAYGSAESAVESLKAGAFDYLTKPVDLKQFRAVVSTALAAQAPPAVAAQERSTAPAPLAAERDPGSMTHPAGEAALHRLVGNSALMQNVRARIVKAARSMAPVLVRGESGTGKELVAKGVHACSHRSEGPFVAVNCGAIPEALLEAEFFGARKGSFTGATQDRPGFFQAAQGGTLFLDEIGELPLSMQAKLLRALQERKVRALGTTQEEAVDVRIVSATHRDLAAAVQQGTFRQDLYYRLNVIEILLPALRDRLEDLPALCDALLDKLATESGYPIPHLTPRQLRTLASLPLEGNVRELENLLQRAIALGDESKLQLDTSLADDPEVLAIDIPLTPSTTPEFPIVPPAPVRTSQVPASDTTLPADLSKWLDEQERQVLVKALEETNFNRTAAAAKLGLNLRQIRYRMARLNINAPGHDDDA
ncbi:sigma-54-dependent Fis family transcriptional regulator [Comamonas serinivorans]|uniref:Sigma-54-dependent Fis family transcriptional regulator n=1 Tax=Comamonas serinivorans TaxID=1082851 RepID=A0A1Y0EQJ7_9BURK|nr:sigma-54 dependent transcriptional regulator [Comamonas serinivorans]ARU05925.1 sigma-54-dependent Fis family transcriptional regulator [Comamonas serinivorans]